MVIMAIKLPSLQQSVSFESGHKQDKGIFAFRSLLYRHFETAEDSLYKSH